MLPHRESQTEPRNHSRLHIKGVASRPEHQGIERNGAFDQGFEQERPSLKPSGRAECGRGENCSAAEKNSLFGGSNKRVATLDDD